MKEKLEIWSESSFTDSPPSCNLIKQLRAQHQVDEALVFCCWWANIQQSTVTAYCRLLDISQCNSQPSHIWRVYCEHYRKCWHSVAVDKAPEMFVNKYLKQAVVRANKGEYLTWMATFFPYRSQALHNLQEQLFPECYPGQKGKKYSNIEAMRSKIAQISLFTDGIHRFHLWTKIMLHPSNKRLWGCMFSITFSHLPQNKEKLQTSWKGCHKTRWKMRS